MTVVLASLGAAVLVVLTAIAVLALARADEQTQRRDRVVGDATKGLATAPAWFAGLLRRAEIAQEPDEVWPTSRNVLVVSAVAMAVVVPALALLAVVVAAVASAGAPMVLRHRRAAMGDDELIAVAEVLATQLAVGASLAQAVQRAGQGHGLVAQELQAVVSAHRQGAPLGAALDHWAAGHDRRGARLLSDAVALAGSSGGSQALAVRGVVATLVERRSLDREVAALGSQARASAAVLVVTPVIFATLAAAADPNVRDFLVGTSLGWACLAAGAILDVAGAWWMQRMTRWVS